MKDIKTLIKTITGQEKVADQFGTGKVYSDEPILFTASQMKNYTPPKYREMRRITGSDYYLYRPEAEIFYRQARFMEDFEDDFEYRGGFFSYYPTYQSMNNLQLRGYFSWRTQVRRGNIKAVSFSFACVYMYELINQIGVSSPTDGFLKLKSFSEEYSKFDRKINPYAANWLRDYVVYYGLDKQLLEKVPFFEGDAEMLTLLHYQEHSEQEVISALSSLSSYSITDSRFYQEYPEELAKVVYGVYRGITEFFEQKRKHSAMENFFGSRMSTERTMFTSAVFYEQKSHPDCEYEINELYKYICRDGHWTFEQCYRYRQKKTLISDILKETDRIMRERYSFRYVLKPTELSKIYLKIITGVIDEFLEEKRRAAVPEIKIDTSLLSSIRESSMITQSKLIVDEEEENEADAVSPPPQQPADSPLDETESEFLSCVLNNKSYAELLRGKHIMASVMVDAVNEKLFDIFGDTALILSGDSAEVIEDYKEELKGLTGL